MSEYGFGNFESPTGFVGLNLQQPTGIAIDGSGNVWVPSLSQNVTEFVGLAVSVKTPAIGPPQLP